MGTNKSLAHKLALEFWRNTGRAGGRCDTCSCDMKSGEGYLSNPGPLHGSSPDLLCETCYDKYAWSSPYQGKVPTKDPMAEYLKQLEKRSKPGCFGIIVVLVVLTTTFFLVI